MTLYHFLNIGFSKLWLFSLLFTGDINMYTSGSILVQRIVVYGKDLWALGQNFKIPLLNKLILNSYFFILGLRVQNAIFQIDSLYTMPHFTMQINVFTKLILAILVKFGKHSVRVNIYQWVQFFYMEEFSDISDLYIFLYHMIFCQSIVHLLPVNKIP